MAIAGIEVISQSTCEQVCMSPEGRENILERGNNALNDPCQGAYPQCHQQQENDDGPQVGSRKCRDDVRKNHKGHTWTLHNL